MPATESTTLDLRVGDVVEVRSEAEILATLDENGELESLPFMPEMLRYCGQRLTVYKVAHKTCDTLTGSGMRRMENAVHLSGVRCDGSAHGGCQAACLIYWKHAWLRKVDPAEAPPVAPTAPAAGACCRLLTIASRRPPAEDGETTVPVPGHRAAARGTAAAAARDLGQFVEDVRTGNAGMFWSDRAHRCVASYNRMQGLSNRFLPPRLRIRGGRHWGFLRGTADKTPTVQTDLQPGDTVRIRSKDGGGADPQRGPAEPRHGLRRRDGPVLRADRTGGPPGRPHRRRAHRPDDPDAEPVHRPRGRGVRGCVQRQLPARRSPRTGARSGSRRSTRTCRPATAGRAGERVPESLS